MSNPPHSSGATPQNSAHASGTYPYYPYYNYYQAVQHAGGVSSPSSMPGQPWPPGGFINGSKRPGEDQSESEQSKRARTSREGEDEEGDTTDNEEYNVPGSGREVLPLEPSANRPTSNLSKQVATDVWRFVRPLQTRERPAVLPPDGPNLYTKPEAPFVGCKLCSGWKTWKCIVGMTSTIRNHLRNAHREEYERICREENLKYAGDAPHHSTSASSTPAAPQPPPGPAQYAYTPAQPPPPGFGYHPSVMPPMHTDIDGTAPAGSPAHGQQSQSLFGEPPRKGTASDVWRFLRPLNTREKPADWVPPADEPILSRKPEALFVGCKLCTPQWRVWKCIDGMTSTIRVHLRKEHQDIYERVVKNENLKQLHPLQKTADYSPALAHPHSDRPRWATNTVATDVWYFMRGLENREQPQNWREPVNEPILEKKPTTPYLGCKLCTLRGQWRTWKCINGMSSTIRKHLINEHGDIYTSVCKQIGLKGPVDGEVLDDVDAEERMNENKSPPVIDPALTAPAPAPAPSYFYAVPSTTPAVDKGKVPVRVQKPLQRPDRAFSTEGFLDKLVRYVVASGQSLDLVEEPAFRGLLLFVGRSLADIDLPDQEKLSQLIEARYQVEQKKLIEDIKSALGRVSVAVELTEDVPPRLAITAHYCVNEDERTLALRSRMIAYRAIPGETRSNPDEVVISAQVFDALQTFGICEKIGVITFGHTLFESGIGGELNALLTNNGFPAADNLRDCLPIVDDAMQSGLDVLMSTQRPLGTTIDQSSELSLALQENKRYREALGRNPISRARDLVSVIAEDSDRLAVLEELRNEEADGSLPRGLLQEDGRWSSKYLMIERALALRPLLSKLLKDEEQTEIAHFLLDDAETDVLSDIKEFLRCAYAVHEMVGEEKLPLAIVAIPLYEQLLNVLKDFQETLPEIQSAMSVTTLKLEEALTESRKSEAYGLSIILNPTAKLKWMDDNWTAEERDKAKALILQKMLEHHQKSKAQSQNDDSSSATQSGSAKETPKSLSALNRLLGRNSRRQPHKPGRATSSTEAGEEATDHNDELKSVEAELQRYIEAGVLESGDEYDNFDIFRYWKVRERGYPLLYRVALDVLPAQASVFTSGISQRTSRFSKAKSRSSNPMLDEMVTILRYAYDPEKLDFTYGWIAKEDELRISDDPVV
ncbi:hypothetical protein GLOTRDRAFT_139276 [Gloeophyllum trabeum ATCC 11539]|uniref:HAT C-terminal dimerisation domain-containing protein n=1 Tax=Gloeophyllum trabeum (strain ATCC 11539 / FP-39264 / Madison 617) TaxID=670483 RepID=S7RPJ2_GLOTA|nr:uncharacterized protein GLOTRDRAFT_139276 [Gloeophyllum trabeum ATCC 11539]EPQ54779.1 hypothetical protein GLOTRDRAFT_139276 [Gloeophyllum trabeum ATCC 11539]